MDSVGTKALLPFCLPWQWIWSRKKLLLVGVDLAWKIYRCSLLFPPLTLKKYNYLTRVFFVWDILFKYCFVFVYLARVIQLLGETEQNYCVQALSIFERLVAVGAANLSTVGKRYGDLSHTGSMLGCLISTATRDELLRTGG